MFILTGWHASNSEFHSRRYRNSLGERSLRGLELQLRFHRGIPRVLNIWHRNIGRDKFCGNSKITGVDSIWKLIGSNVSAGLFKWLQLMPRTSTRVWRSMIAK